MKFLYVRKVSAFGSLMWFLVVASAQMPVQATASEAAAITPQDPASVQRGIIAAYKAGQRQVVIPPGVYPVSLLEEGGVHLKFEGLHDFSIEAYGVTLVMADATKCSVLFRDCRHVALRGATIRNATPVFTQGVIESVAFARTSCDVRIDAGYPTRLDNPAFFKNENLLYLFDVKTHLLKQGSHDTNWSGVERLGPDLFRLHAKSFFRPEITSGDHFAIPGSGGMGILNEGCGDLVFEDVKMEYSGGFGFMELWGDGGNVYRRIKVQPGPKPVGAIREPLLSEPGDGFHSAAMRRGPTIEDSSFLRMGDDGIAIHGYFLTVREVRDNKMILSQGKPLNYFAPGDHLEAVSALGTPIGTAVVTMMKRLPDNTLPLLASSFKILSEHYRFCEVVLDHPLPIKAGDFVYNADRVGSGFVLRHNTIRDHRARGMMLKACNGLVENNDIEGSSISGIAMVPQLGWGEAGFCRDVMVRGNTVAHVGYATVSTDSRQAGAICVVGELETPGARGNHNISIEGNTIRDVNGVNLELDGVEGCTVRGNQFIGAQHKSTDRGSKEVNPSALIFINRAKDVLLADNIVVNWGSAGEELVTTTTNATAVQGKRDGLRVVAAAR